MFFGTNFEFQSGLFFGTEGVFIKLGHFEFLLNVHTQLAFFHVINYNGNPTWHGQQKRTPEYYIPALPVFLGNISHPSICFCLHTQDPYRLRKHTMFYHTTLGDIRSKPAYLLFSLEIMQDPQTGLEREWQSLENNIVKNHEVKEHKRGKMLQ